jgi:hypothetical protein
MRFNSSNVKAIFHGIFPEMVSGKSLGRNLTKSKPWQRNSCEVGA